MADKIQQVPPKRVETETPTEVHDSSGSVSPEHKKMERMADRLAHKANKDEQNFDSDHTTFSNIGPK